MEKYGYFFNQMLLVIVIKIGTNPTRPASRNIAKQFDLRHFGIIDTIYCLNA